MLAPRAILAVCLVGIVGGVAAWFLGSVWVADLAWAIVVVAALIPLSLTVGRNLLRGRLGVDVIALLAMAGSLPLRQFLAGAVIAVMLSGGQVLEGYAKGRARRELAHLLALAPHRAHRQRAGGLHTVPVGEVVMGDRLVVLRGEMVPVDGVLEEAAVLDEAALTGEARPVERTRSDRVASGAINVGPPFQMRAVATSEGSTYAGIVRLVRQAEASKAPFIRLADRFSMVFLPVTLGVAGLAWALSGDPVRALAVLVVATPCPLILAAPVAIVSGISRAARSGIIVKGGAALEKLAQGRILFIDKTGTLTMGNPQFADLIPFGDDAAAETLRLAASLDQVSAHVLAAPIVAAARIRGLALTFPTEVVERLGSGIQGRVDGHEVRVGKASWLLVGAPVPGQLADIRESAARRGRSNVFVAVDGRLAAAILLEDPIRSDAAATIARLRTTGIRRVVLLSGDHAAVADPVGALVGADAVFSDLSPAAKVDAVHREGQARVSIMVGDGINDAPVLAVADVGVAMGVRGATAASEAADVVLVVDRLEALAEAITIASRTQRIALQSVIAGMGLSFAAMGLATLGLLPPLVGAVVQEAIDVVVILNALRALGGGMRSASESPVLRPTGAFAEPIDALFANLEANAASAAAAREDRGGELLTGRWLQR